MVTTTVPSARETWPRGPRLYAHVRGWFISRGRHLHGFLKPHGFRLDDARGALTGSSNSERAMRVIELVERELQITIEREAA